MLVLPFPACFTLDPFGRNNLKLEEYPSQEPLTSQRATYQEEVLRRGNGIVGIETIIGDDPYQSLSVYPAASPDGTVLTFLHGGGWTQRL